MAAPAEYSFERYLAAKRAIDDRSLNLHVWQALLAALPAVRPLQVLEIGAGIGTMLDRLHAWSFPAELEYTGIDADAGVVEQARARHKLPQPGINFEAIDLDGMIARERSGRKWHVLIAHAFMDLVDAERVLPGMLRLLHPGGLLYLTLNFDGVTTLLPVLDAELDARLERIYHQTMDQRVVRGRRAGHSRTGRQLLMLLPAAGVTLLASGSSDWVVHATTSSYTDDAEYFLHYIIHTMHGALAGNPQVSSAELDAWAAQRHGQAANQALVYVAHQLDFLGQAPQ